MGRRARILVPGPSSPCAGRFSNSSASATVYATNAASSGGSALYGVASGTDSIGLYANATASGGTGVLAYGDGNAVNGNSNGDVLNTAGVLGVAGYRTGVGGIAGVWGDAAQHVGVIGSSVAYSGVYGASTNSYGVQASSANGAAVYGVSGSSSNPSVPGPIGFWGDVTGDPYTQGVNTPGAAVVGTESMKAVKARNELKAERFKAASSDPKQPGPRSGSAAPTAASGAAKP